jgi:glycosyltransferase involved in cell wall biosynthesis
LKQHPAAYCRLLVEALRTRSVVDFLLAFQFAPQMAEHQVKMIHCVYGDHKFFIGYYCKQILHIPLSVALYGYDLRANPNWTLFRRAIHSADQVVVNCDYNKRLFVDAVGNGIQPSVKVIRHYAEIPVLPSQVQDTVKILMVGGFSERKGHDVLFRAIRSLGAEAANLEVWVVGYPDAVDVEQLARDFQVTDKVVVFGTVSDQGLNYFYQHCDIFCLPSKTDHHGISEGLPVALIEAMAYGKPVISTRLAGIPELVEQVLVEEGDVESLARAIKSLADDPVLRRSLGARNLAIVSDRYSRQNVSMMRDTFFETVGVVEERDQ